MTAKIKLNAASGGGSFSLQAPSSSANTRVMTLPDTADGTILTTTNPKAGNIIQVKQTVKTDTFSSTSDTFTDLTGLSVSMAASSASNKILIRAILQYGVSNNGYAFGRLLKDSTAIGLGGASGFSNVESVGFPLVYPDIANSEYTVQTVSYEFLTTAGDTSSHTYKLQGRQHVGGSYTFYINRTHVHSNQVYLGSYISTITAMEVAV